MPGLDPGIHAPPLAVTLKTKSRCPKAWMAGSRPAMTYLYSNYRFLSAASRNASAIIPPPTGGGATGFGVAAG